MKALHFQDSTKYALNIKNLFFKAHGKDGLISEKKKKKEQHCLFIHQQMYLITSQREKRANLVTWKAKAWIWGGIILLEKSVLNKVSGCFSVFKRGAFV